MIFQPPIVGISCTFILLFAHRGAVPPGARFDPFAPPAGPPGGRRPGPPDADHLPPPGFNDNMFM